MRLIDADALVEYKVTGEIDNLSGDFVPGFAIAMAPIIDAEPVRHGRWENEVEKYPGMYGYIPLSQVVCSVCDRAQEKKTSYCPNCGAKMNKGVQNDQN